MGQEKAHFQKDFDTFSVEIGSVFENGFCSPLLRFGGERGGQVYIQLPFLAVKEERKGREGGSRFEVRG